MAKDYCKYHPLTTAKWWCPHCCVKVCDDCAPVGNDIESAPPCVMCGGSLDSLAGRVVVKPFWQRFTEFLQLPFNWLGGCLLLLCAVLPFLMPENRIPYAGAAGYFLASLAGWAILTRTASGRLDFPDPLSLTRSLGPAAVQMAGLTALVLTALVLAAAHAPAASVLAVIAVSILGPLTLVAIANEKGVSGLRDQDAFRRVAGAMGLMLMPAAGFTLALMLVLQAVTGLLGDVATPAAVQSIRNGLYGYGVWVVSALAGYCQHQYRPVFEAHYEELRQQRARRSAVRRMDPNAARLELLLKEGMYEKAVALLKGWSEKQKNNAEVHARYFQLLVFLKDKDAVAWQGENYMAALLAGGHGNEAVGVLQKIRMVMPGFHPEEPAVSFDLAKACLEQREFRMAAELLDGLHQTAPHFPDLAEAYMLRARVLHEKLQQSDKALEVMNFLVARFQKHPRFEVMQAYWKQLGGKPAASEFLI